jgi:RNA polymerase sigma-70 factor (ECF subfamily)
MHEMTAPRVLSEEYPNQVTQAVERIRTDPTAFRPVYEEYFPRIYRYCLRRVSCPQEAEDLTSQIFTRALANLSSYRGGSMPAWLFRIAHNVVANHLRDRRVTIPLEELEEAESVAEGDGALGRVMDDEERLLAARLIEQLPDEQRELLALRIAGGLSAKEVGQVIGKSEGAVRVAIHRIVQQLRMAWTLEETR